MNKLAIDSLRDIALVLKEGSMLDQMVLGMERLCFLTNPLSSGDMALITFSNMPQEILQKVRDTIMLFRKQSEKSDDFSIDDWDIPDVDEYYNTILHNQAMKVIQMSSGDMALITFSNMPQEILQKIRDTIMLFRKQSETSDDFSIDDWDIPDVDEYYNTILHNQAMKVMSNLILLSNEASFSRYPCNDLVPSLLNIMKDAACQPQEAYHACRCLGAILQMKYSTRDELLRNDALDIFEKTQLVGKCSHLLLEEESGRIINSLIC
eukprot:CAMPEP_0194393048 /NCGR_PEP_ID=MMETSP0174-20130528/123076_1 /TAXON_ID=216777 /ORGANISM="Proboscia alata, Strain PI-D3" /LENGTH=264 /DNA_ID=CAMNT_0039188683 /DNA_START=835 /DNA_END=1630 /DNA_ORIENTATION=+